MTRLAWRNLWQHRGRLLVAVAGIGLALTLILALDAILNGMERQISQYIERSGAEIWVAQRGVANLHMITSTLPTDTVTAVASVPGIAEATPLLYVAFPIMSRGESRLAYVIGLEEGAAVGGPWNVVAGEAVPDNDEIVLGTGLAQALAVGVGDDVEVFGRRHRVVGLHRQEESLGSSVVFVTWDDFARARRVGDTVSFVLATIEPGASASAVAEAIEATVPGVSASTRTSFARNERRVVKDMGADVVDIMNLIGFVVGLVATALIVYLATLARRAEYGVLKALGATDRHLIEVVLVQAATSVALGRGVATLLTWLLRAAAPAFGVGLTLAPSVDGFARVGAAAVVMAALASALPVWQIARLDPSRVFRGGPP